MVLTNSLGFVLSHATFYQAALLSSAAISLPEDSDVFVVSSHDLPSLLLEEDLCFEKGAMLL